MTFASRSDVALFIYYLFTVFYTLVQIIVLYKSTRLGPISAQFYYQYRYDA